MKKTSKTTATKQSSKKKSKVNAATIKGVPVWKLNGVTDANQKHIEETGLAVHYGNLGYNGWGLIAPETLREAVLTELRQYGISARPWKILPKKSSMGLVIFGVFFLGISVITIPNEPFQVLFLPLIIGSIVISVWLSRGHGCGTIKYGVIARQLVADKYENRSYTTNPRYAGLPGNIYTTEE
jgi:hypothetical protein